VSDIGCAPVVKFLAYDPKIKGLNPITGTEGEKMVKSYSKLSKFKKMRDLKVLQSHKEVSMIIKENKLECLSLKTFSA